MPSLKAIRKRVASVKNTQKITRAMKLVSAAKLRRAQQAMEQQRLFAKNHRKMLGSLLSKVDEHADSPPHALLTQRSEIRKVGILALASDRSMCGGFNSNLGRALERHAAEFTPPGSKVEVYLYPLGRRVGTLCNKLPYSIGEDFGDIIPAAKVERAQAITSKMTEAFLSGEIDEAWILVNRFRSALSHVPTLTKLLPLGGVDEKVTADDQVVEMFFEPSWEVLLDHFLPRHVAVEVRVAILESIAGEHAARMNAMSAATDNASEMISALTLEMNRARQAAITKELMEVIGGAEAMN